MSKKQNLLLGIFKVGFKNEVINEADILKNLELNYKNGIEYLKKQELDLAQECFIHILEIKPIHLDTILQLSKVYSLKKDYEQAINLLKNFLNDKPNSFDAKLRLSTVYIKSKQFELAIGLLNQLKNTQTSPKQINKISIAFAKTYYSEAEFYKKNSKFKEAIACYEQATKFDNDKEKSMFFIALCYKDMKKYSKSIDIFNSILEIYDQKNENPYLFDIYFYLGEIEEKQGNNGKAIMVYQKFIEIEPQKDHNHFFLAKINFLQKDYAKAIENFNLALKNEKYLYEIYLKLANAYSIQKNYNESLNCYQELLKIKQDDNAILLNIAIIKIKIGDTTQAFEILNDIIVEGYEKNPDITKNLGLALLELGMSEQAIEKLNIAQKFLLEDPEIIVYLGLCYKMEGDRKSSNVELQKAIKMSPNNLIVLKEQAQSYIENMDFEKSFEIYNKMISLDVREKNTIKLIANLHKKNKNFKEAISKYNEYLSSFANDVEAIYNLALCYFELIEMNNAILEFKKLKDNNQYGFLACSTLAKIYISKGDMNNALEFVQKSIEYSPNYIDGYLKYGKIYIHLGKIDDAIKYFNYAKSLDPSNKEVDEISKIYITNYVPVRSNHVGFFRS